MDNEKNSFEFYNYLKKIINEMESEEEYNEIIILKKLLFTILCELSTFFLDNVFLISKLKFENFEDNKSYSNVLGDIIYQIGKNFNTFQYRVIINLYETLILGGFEKDSLIFFIKVVLCFYFTHQKALNKLSENYTIYQYENAFKGNYFQGFKDMKSLLKVIPMIELSNSEDDDFLIQIFRINNDDNKNNLMSKSVTSLPPITQKSYNSTGDNFFQTQIKKV